MTVVRPRIARNQAERDLRMVKLQQKISGRFPAPNQQHDHRRNGGNRTGANPHERTGNGSPYPAPVSSRAASGHRPVSHPPTGPALLSAWCIRGGLAIPVKGQAACRQRSEGPYWSNSSSWSTPFRRPRSATSSSRRFGPFCVAEPEMQTEPSLVGSDGGRLRGGHRRKRGRPHRPAGIVGNGLSDHRRAGPGWRGR